jgi:hypothetical protein
MVHPWISHFADCSWLTHYIFGFVFVSSNCGPCDCFWSFVIVASHILIVRYSELSQDQIVCTQASFQQCLDDRLYLSIKMTKSLFRLVIGATLTIKVHYMWLVEIQPSLISDLYFTHSSVILQHDQERKRWQCSWWTQQWVQWMWSWKRTELHWHQDNTKEWSQCVWPWT